MTTFLPIRAAKELRELLPLWAATLAGIGVLGWLGHDAQSRHGNVFVTPILVIYVMGAVSVGPWSIGHEYSHRTLGALLAQPIDRRRILLVKLAVLMPLLTGLGIAGALALGALSNVQRTEITSFPGFIVLTPICGLCLAPWLTMACRSPLAGAVFAVSLPFMVFVIGLSNEFALEQIVAAVLVLNTGAAWMTWRSFLRLEAIEGPQAEIDVPGWLNRNTSGSRPATRSHSALWLLMKKELRLQQMTFIISAIFVASWVVVLTLRRVVPDFMGPDLFSLATMHGLVVVIVAGSLPSAEERHLGTAAWQSLMPMATWRQWGVKAGLTVTLGFALVFGLPLVMALVSPQGNELRVHRELVLSAFMIIIGTLYISSLNSSGMRAMLATFPTAAAAGLIFSLMVRPLGSMAGDLLRPIAARVTPFTFSDWREWHDWSQWTNAATLTPMVFGLAWLILAFGLTNHRSAERPASRVGQQVGWIVLYVLVASNLLSCVSELLRAGIR